MTTTTKTRQFRLHLDSSGFLAELERLGRRFDGALANGAAGAATKRKKDAAPAKGGDALFDVDELADGAIVGDDPLDFAPCLAGMNRPAEHDGAGERPALRPAADSPDLADLTRLATALFGATCWPMMIVGAAHAGHPALVARVHRFLRQTEALVRRQGLAGWLAMLIEDAILAAETDRPSPLMPVMRIMTPGQAVDQLEGDDRRRFGTKKQRLADLETYVFETNRMAAAIVLRWGGDDEVGANRLAALLLTDTGLGLSLLRHVAGGLCRPDPNDRAPAALRYLTRLDVALDLDYARWLARQHGGEGEDGAAKTAPDGTRATLPDGEGSVADESSDNNGETEADLLSRRYLRDVDRLLEACDELWERRTHDATAMLDEVRAGRTAPRMPVWHNPVALRRVLDSLVGSWAGSMLQQGFETRDRALFDAGASYLCDARELVDGLGLGFLPMMTMTTLALQFESNGGSVGPAATVLAHWPAITFLPGRDEGGGNSGGDDSSGDPAGRRMTKGKLNGYLRAYGTLCDDMATVMLDRIPDPAQARKTALAILCGDQHDQTEALLPLCTGDVFTAGAPAGTDNPAGAVDPVD
ncbi:hypothetical protein [Bifidobacterium choloepi]|uniref:Riboflavin deaminase n=1 Tax=Bifidobacterium choloepi TaxID=2614131 RepID=A0A6I5N1K4_9BIFI|nr:hypothetical protein [Bifidobacterium choloepi]NEG70497.1 hypothetical protein [Bifidobacterium choloepi]